MQNEETRLCKQQNIRPSRSTLYCLPYHEVFLGEWGHNTLSHPLDF